MRLSDDKVNYITHRLINHIMKDDNFDIYAEENDVRLKILKIINNDLKIGDEIEQRVQMKLNSYSRKIIEGTNEWNLLYRRFYDEELNKLGRL